MGRFDRRGFGGGRIFGQTVWVWPCVLALMACGGESSGDDDDDDDDAGESGSAGKAGSGAGAAGGTAPTGGSGASGGSGAIGGTGGTGGTSAGAGGTASGSAGRAGGAGSGGNAGQAGSGGGAGTPVQIGDCDDFTPCGGDPEGTWTVTDTCVEVTIAGGTPAGCENMFRDVQVDIEGTYAFANGTVTTDAVSTNTVTLAVDDVCAQALSGSNLITAAALCPLLEEQSTDPTAMMTCEVEGAECICVQTSAPTAANETGSYEVVGTQLIAADSDPIDFCVDASTLLLRSAAPADADGFAALAVVLELTREQPGARARL